MVAALSAAAGVGATLTVQRVTAPSPSTAGMARDAGADRLNGAAALNDEAVYRAVEPGVVDVAANLAYLQETAKGTGFVIDAAAGLILTNNHVINGATSVTITPVTSGRSYPARILGYDRDNDVALLQVLGAPRLRAVTIGSSARARVGTPVLAIGNEGGQGGSPTVAPGVISSLDRIIIASDQSSGLTETLDGMLQTSADIRPGDWEGHWRGADGRVIGIDTERPAEAPSIPATPSRSTGPCRWPESESRPAARAPGSRSACPRSSACSSRTAAAPIPAGRAARNSTRPATRAAAAAAVPAAKPRRLRPASPRPGPARWWTGLPGTPADQAGLFAGDVVTSVGGRPVTSPRSLTALLSRYRPGSRVALAWVAPGASLHTAVVTLTAGPAG